MKTNSKTPVTVIILTHRHDRRLERALHSVHWADQVLVVNTKNDLDLSQVAQEFEIEVIHQPTSPESFHFGMLRNQALTKAKHEWVFFLDSDEWLPAKWVPEIQMLIDKDTCYAAAIKRQDIFLGRLLRWGEVGAVQLVRLGKKSHLQYSRAVHEIPFTAQHVCSTPVTIMHESHTSIGEFFSKISWYAQLEAQERQRQDRRVSLTEAVTFPLGKFVFNYFWKRGLLDGWRGLIYAIMMSFHSFFVRIYLYELQKP